MGKEGRWDLWNGWWNFFKEGHHSLHNDFFLGRSAHYGCRATRSTCLHTLLKLEFCGTLNYSPQSISDLWTSVLPLYQYWTSNNSFLTRSEIPAPGLTPATKTASNTLNVNYSACVSRLSKDVLDQVQLEANCTVMIPHQSDKDMHACAHLNL